MQGVCELPVLRCGRRIAYPGSMWFWMQEFNDVRKRFLLGSNGVDVVADVHLRTSQGWGTGIRLDKFSQWWFVRGPWQFSSRMVSGKKRGLADRVAWLRSVQPGSPQWSGICLQCHRSPKGRVLCQLPRIGQRKSSVDLSAGGGCDRPVKLLGCPICAYTRGGCKGRVLFL